MMMTMMIRVSAGSIPVGNAIDVWQMCLRETFSPPNKITCGPLGPPPPPVWRLLMPLTMSSMRNSMLAAAAAAAAAADSGNSSSSRQRQQQQQEKARDGTVSSDALVMSLVPDDGP